MTLEHKALLKGYSDEFGFAISALSGSYIYFFLEAIRRLNANGRLVFITPTEFLDARYGEAMKRALQQLGSIDELVVLEMDRLAFDGVLTTSVITVATRRKAPLKRLRLVEGRLTPDSVERGREIILNDVSPRIPWTALLPSRADRLLPLLKDRTIQLREVARVRRGIATGDNAFFCLTQAEADLWGIEPQFLVPGVVGSRDLPISGALTRSAWDMRRLGGARVWLFWCHLPEWALIDTNALRYIRHGEELGLPQRYNCRVRDPWYSIEQVPAADFFATYMARDNARFVRNDAGARCLTSLLNVWALPTIGIDALQGVLEDQENSLLLREFGRTYGGGLGKIEPGDLLNLPIRDPRAETT